MAVVMKHVQAGALSSHGNGQIRKGEAMGAMRSAACKLTHSGEHAPLNSAIDSDLTQALERSVNGRYSIDAPCVHYQLVAHGPAPCDIATLDGREQKLACTTVPASEHPGRGVGQDGALAVPK